METLSPEELERRRQQAIADQEAANARAAGFQTPTVQTAQGTSTTTFDPTTGQMVVTETLSPEERAVYEGAQAARQAEQAAYGNIVGQVASSGPFNYQSGLTDFETARSTMEQNAIASFDAQNQKYFDLQKQQLEQQLQNQGVPVNSEEYDRRMRALLETQATQRQQAVRDAYESSFKATQGAQAVDIQADRLGYDIAAGNYKLPIEASSYFKGATQYETPNFGGRGANVAPTNAGNISLGYSEVEQREAASKRSAEVSREEIATRLSISQDELAQNQSQFEAKMKSDEELAALDRELKAELAKGDLASREKIAELQRRAQLKIARISSETSKATAGAGSLTLGDRMALLGEENRIWMDQFFTQKAAEQAEYAF